MQGSGGGIASFFNDAGNIIAVSGLLLATIAAMGPIFVYLSQRKRENVKAVGQLHAQWWSPEFSEYRQVVWDELEAWKSKGDESPAMQHYSGRGSRWLLSDMRSRSHSRILFFFSELNTLIEKSVVDEDLLFEVFGLHQYEFFRDYFGAIQAAVLAGLGDRLPPWYLRELAGFERRLDRWKAGVGSKYLSFREK